MIAPDAVLPEALPVVLTIAGTLWLLLLVKGWWRA